MKRFIALLSFPAALAVAGCTHSADRPATSSAGDSSMPPMSSSAGTSQTALDLHNTVCPVSGDKVETSRLMETYDGKVYHLCCADCVKPFKKDPAKYAKRVADDPAKYGVTPTK